MFLQGNMGTESRESIWRRGSHSQRDLLWNHCRKAWHMSTRHCLAIATLLSAAQPRSSLTCSLLTRWPFSLTHQQFFYCPSCPLSFCGWGMGSSYFPNLTKDQEPRTNTQNPKGSTSSVCPRHPRIRFCPLGPPQKLAWDRSAAGGG